MDVETVINLLNLQRHPEGGYYRETYRCKDSIPQSALPGRYPAARSVSTCIYYMLTPDTFSCIHRVASDELFHFYLGDTIEMLQLLPDGSTKILKIGSNLLEGETPQLVIEGGIWQGSRLVEGGKFALIGATVAPGFEYVDYEEASRGEMLSKYPDQKDMIIALTRKP